MRSRRRLALPYLWIVALIAVALWRFYQIRDLVLPSWVDSVHHTLLVRLLLEQRTIPQTWGPYLPETPFYYHFGFHVAAALFAQLTGLTGLELGRAVLIFGQLLQTAFALSIYGLGWMIWRSRAKALVAMLLVGFVSEMPAFYVTWGRYTLLAGLLVLVLALIAAYARKGWELGLLAATAAITHLYAFFLLYPLLLFLFLLLPENRKAIALGGTIGLLLSAPWLIRVVRLGQRYARVETSGYRVQESTDQIWKLLGPTHNYFFLAIAGIGLGWVTFQFVRRASGGVQAEKRIVPVAGFALLLLTLMGPWTIGPFRPDHAAIVLFLPAVLLSVEAIWLLKSDLLIGTVVGVGLLIGGWYTKDIVRPDTVLANRSDVAAIEWIQNHTDPDAVFLVDTSPWTRIWRGADGGWWIMPLTGRRTIIPPIAYSWSSPAVIQSITKTAVETANLRQKFGIGYCSSLKDLMGKTGADYYYTRDKQGRVCPGVTVAHTVDDINILQQSLR